jgi:signal transduction histidine kinase
LLAWNLLVLFCILLAVGVAVYILLARSLTAEVDRSLMSHSADLSQTLGRSAEPSDRDDYDGYRGSLFYVVFSSNGTVETNPQQVDLTSIPLALSHTSAPRFATITLAGDATRLFARPDRDRGPSGAVVIVGQSLAPEQRALNRAALGLSLGALFGLLLSLAGAWFLSGRALVPIETAFRRQQDFIADASHELRTPLTVLSSATELLDQHRSEPLSVNGELFDDVRHEIGRLQRLVDDLLTLARADLNGLALAVAPLDLIPLVAEVVQRVTPLARVRGVTVTFAPTASVRAPVLLEADPDRLQQVFLILIDNALKYTKPGGSITLRVEHQGGDAFVTVHDTGEGIPAEHLSRVFDRFFRGDVARTRSSAAGGAGLGLSIAKSLVEAQGGQLTLSSQVGEGTVAVVRLPVLRERAGWLGQLTGRLAHRSGRA